MAPKKDYTPLQMGQAIEAVRKGEKIATAAKKYGVPRITLYDKISGKSPRVCSMGPSTYLSAEEESILEKWLLDMSKNHIPITKDELLDSVQRIIIDTKKETPFTGCRPGKKWYSLFLKRHPVISERTAQNLTTARDVVTEEGLLSWFKEVESFLEEKDLTDVVKDPRRVFNTDETAIYLSPKAGKVLAQRGDKHIYQSSGDEKDNLTVLITGNAAGKLAPPMVVFSYERIPSSISATFPEEWGIGRSPSGWMCGSTFYEYITNIFNPWLLRENIPKPVIFFLDGHRSHLTLHLSNFCLENQIEIIALHPNSTHILQPMDISVFRALKLYWKKAVNTWKMEHLGQNLKKENFGPVLKTALQSIAEESIKNGFRAGGLYPFGPDYVDMTKIKPRPKSQLQVQSTAQNEFLIYLEKEIVEKFGSEKLVLFKELFFETRTELNSRLPKEDLSLYIIWVNNKQTIVHTDHNVLSTSAQSQCQSPTAPSTVVRVSEPSTSTSAAPPPCESCTVPLPVASTSKDQQAQSEDFVCVSDLVTSTPSPLLENSTASPRTAKNTCTDIAKNINQQFVHSDPVGVQSTFAQSNCEHIAALVPDTDTSLQKHKDSDYICEPSTSGQIITNYPSIPNPSVNPAAIANNKTPMKQAIGNETSKAKPAMKSNAGASSVIIPSPFKRNLYWPNEDDKTVKGKKRKLKEKIPCAATSEKWRDYHVRKEKERLEKEQEKEQRKKEKERKKEEREEKKQAKLKSQQQNKKSNKRKRSSKQKPKDTSSDETDTEVQFVESDNSYNIEVDEKLETRKDDTSESEDVPLSQLQDTRTYSKGDYVIIKYEGEYFPGVIENVDRNTFEISTMTFSVGNTFKWPEKVDKIWYQEKDIIEEISAPVLTNKRGFYTIKEMSKYQTFTM